MDAIDMPLAAAAPARRRLTRARPECWIGGIIVGLVVFVALFAPWLSPHSPFDQSLDDRLIRPVFLEGGGWNHPLGTDHLGRDYLSRLFYGARVSLVVGIGAMALSGLIGISLGIAAGFLGGAVDLAVMFMLSVRLSLPIMLLAIAVVGLLGNSLPLLMTVLAGFLWDRFLVVTRSLAMRLKESDFVLAARAAGYSNWRIMWSEILPNLAGPILVIATVEISHAILLEAALSFLGLGVRPPASSWGLMIAEAKDFVFFEPWLVNIPGAAIFILIGGLMVLGEGLRAAAAGPAHR